MNYRRLGRSGLLVSELSYGSWLTFGKQIDPSLAKECMYAAYDAGVNFFDNAEVYAEGRSEEVMGEILKKAGWDRTTLVISSKVFWGGDRPNQKGLSRKHVFEACHAALRRLQVEYLDLYFCHRPDRDTPMEETVRAMHDLVQQGKVLYWGTSEWSAQEIMEAYSVARAYHLTPPTMEQPQYNMLHRDRVESEYEKLYAPDVIGLGTTVWSPLASGLLTGKYNDGIPEGSRATRHDDLPWVRDMFEGGEVSAQLEKVRQLTQLAQDINISMPHLALAWCLKNPHVSTAITGASRVEQLKSNLQAVEHQDKLTDEVMERIEGVLQNKPKITRW